ncbi:MAG: hydroxymethylglutaryl-CoA lyase [Vicinamibacterales bacterium]
MDLSALRGRRVTLVEVGPRDGLQNEAAVIPTAEKVAFVDRLSAAGLPVIEVSAFVNPKRVPQMSDAAEVLASIHHRPGTRYSALVPNLQGLDRAAAAGVREVAIFAAASDGFSRANINASVEESLASYAVVCERAHSMKMIVRGYLSTAFGCPYDGAVDPERVAELTQRLLDMGVFEVAISDTIGVAHPGQVASLLDVGTEGDVSRTDRSPLPRHERHRARECADGALDRCDDLRRVGRRTWRLSLCTRRIGQSRHRGSDLHAGWIGRGDRRVDRRGRRGVGRDREEPGTCTPLALRAGAACQPRPLTHAAEALSSMWCRLQAGRREVRLKPDSTRRPNPNPL